MCTRNLTRWLEAHKYTLRKTQHAETRTHARTHLHLVREGLRANHCALFVCVFHINGQVFEGRRERTEGHEEVKRKEHERRGARTFSAADSSSFRCCVRVSLSSSVCFIASTAAAAVSLARRASCACTQTAAHNAQCTELHVHTDMRKNQGRIAEGGGRRMIGKRRHKH